MHQSRATLVRININLVYSSCLKHANEMLLGDLRQADQRTQSFHFPIVIPQSLDPAALESSAQAPSFLFLHALRALDRLRTRRRVGSTRRRGNHMHDHSRFQRDIDDVTGVSLSLSLSLYYYYYYYYWKHTILLKTWIKMTTQ